MAENVYSRSNPAPGSQLSTVSKKNSNFGNINRRKRKEPDPSTWKRNVNKMLKDSGLNYTGANGKIRCARQSLPRECKCYRNCFATLTPEQVESLCMEYYSLTYNEQSQYIVGCMSISPIRRRRKRTISVEEEDENDDSDSTDEEEDSEEINEDKKYEGPDNGTKNAQGNNLDQISQMHPNPTIMESNNQTVISNASGDIHINAESQPITNTPVITDTPNFWPNWTMLCVDRTQSNNCLPVVGNNVDRDTMVNMSQSTLPLLPQQSCTDHNVFMQIPMQQAMLNTGVSQPSSYLSTLIHNTNFMPVSHAVVMPTVVSPVQQHFPQTHHSYTIIQPSLQQQQLMQQQQPPQMLSSIQEDELTKEKLIKKKKKKAIRIRGQNFEYTVKLSGHLYPVCQKAFRAIFGLTLTRVRTLQIKMRDGTNVPKDERGRHRNRPNRIDSSIIERVKHHIRSFPSQESHYPRNKTPVYYLSSDLNVRKMYRMYIDTYEYDKANPVVKEGLYRSVFNQFNFRFGVKPGVKLNNI